MAGLEKMYDQVPSAAVANHWTTATAGLPFLYTGANHQLALMCLSPKSGSSAWSFALLLGHATEPTQIKLGATTAHHKNLPVNVSQQQYAAALATPSVPRLAIVRHPVPRLLSGYLGKVIAVPTPAYWPSGYNWSDVDQGFPRFVEYVTSHPNTLVKKTHFQLQTDMCAGFAPGVAPWRYLRIEEVGMWYEGVVCMLGLQRVVSSGWENFKTTTMADRVKKGVNHTDGHVMGRLPCMVHTDCGCVVTCDSRCSATNAAHASFRDANSQLNDYYTRELAELVNGWARADLVQFGYKPWVPGMSLVDTL